MKFLFLLISIFAAYNLESSEVEYKFKQASIDDAQKIVDLIGTEAIKEHDRLVILPPSLRLQIILDNIKKGKLFIATNGSDIVGFKKLYLISDKNERDDMLQNEIRCIGSQANCVYSAQIDQDGQILKTINTPIFEGDYKTCIYDGSDFTHENHRHKCINSSLTNFALATIFFNVKKHITENKSNSISMIYGLVKENAGKVPGDSSDRTPSISKSFKKFIHKLQNSDNPITLEHARYEAFKPEFDQTSDELRILPDQKPGYGCVLVYRLNEGI